MNRKIFIITLAAVLAFGFCGCSFFGVGYTNEDVSESVTEKVSETVDGITEKIADTVGDTVDRVTDTIGTAASIVSGDVLSEDTEIYNAICDGINAYQTEVSFVVPSTLSDGEHLFDIFTQCFNDHPEWFWLNGSAHWETSTLGDKTTAVLIPDMILSIDEVPDMKTQLMDFAAEIAGGAAAYGTQYEQALYVHDTIVNICDYDTETYEAYETSGVQENSITYTSYGCLISRYAVCEGYAKAFQLVMQRLGIECRFVSGTASNSQSTGSHAWNYAVIDGTPCYIDVTWDDPVGDVPEGYISHDYFCISEEQLLMDHTIESM